MKLTFLSALLLLCLPVASFCQFTAAGVSAQAGMSYIHVGEYDYPGVNVSSQNKPMWGAQAGGFAAYHLTQRSGLEAELNVLLQQGKSRYTFTGDQEGTADISNHILYLTLPLRYTYAMGKFSLSGGVQTSLYLHEWGTVDATFYEPNYDHWSNTSSGRNVKFVDFGISLGAQQKISDRLFITLTGFQSLIDLTTSYNLAYATRNTNLMAGIRYALYTNHCSSSACSHSCGEW